MPTRTELEVFLATEFPQSDFLIESLEPEQITLRKPVSFADLRPGGTVSGPTMMALADCALYVAILARIGIVPLAVTTSLSFNFMRKPLSEADLLATCNLLKLGRSLAVGEVQLYSEGDERAVAHAVGTYSIPPQSD
ncbi:PaaI family thioesterase [Halieaceae bacterium IMCC14734]|uniref:PaaI family thioesterase n=1 Tax=Candidatus Litorirhabdus singularis TaxID=2518993 RepID=A0ABT3TJ76_9GAMM|nr:PaaI family thioesterase [Candidatus Litorirhabdus singularis]MCX2982341.1 PaaI family thioesterase [Candidatus Litorirhabdus singularis]